MKIWRQENAANLGQPLGCSAGAEGRNPLCDGFGSHAVSKRRENIPAP
jgi:hypothetical protein